MSNPENQKSEELNGNQFVFEEKIVTVNFNYDDEPVGWKIEISNQTFQSNAVEAFNKELFGKVGIAVALFKDKRKEILAKREELKTQQNIKEHEEEIDKFKDFVNNVVPESFWDLKPIFQTPRGDKWNTTRITFESEQWELTYNAEKDIGGRYSGQHLVKNDRPWTLEFSFSDKRRFKKIETALKRIQEKLDIRKQNKTVAEQKTKALQQLSNQTGMTIKTENEWHNRGRYTSRGYKSEKMFLVPTNETESSTPSIKVHVGYYGPNDIRLGTIELYKEFKVGDFKAHKRVSVSSQFDNDVKGFLTFLKQQRGKNIDEKLY